MTRFTPLPATLALAALVPALLVATPARADALADMVAFDLVYIPALASTNAVSQSPQGPARALAATERLQARWPALRERLQTFSPSPVWRDALGLVQRQIDEAVGAVRRQQWAAAHEALEPVRLRLGEVRVRLGMSDYYIDALTAFHEPMEHIADAAADRQRPLDVAQLTATYAQAAALWRRIENASPSPQRYGLTPAREAQWRQSVAAEGVAMSALSQALRSGDQTALRQAAAAIKPPFSRAFVAFGLADGEPQP